MTRARALVFGILVLSGAGLGIVYAQPGEGHGIPGACTPGPYVEERIRVPRRVTTGPLTRDQVARTILGARGRLAHCASVVFAGHEHRPLEIGVDFVVDASGRASSVTAHASEAPTELLRCVESQIRRIEFPSVDASTESRASLTIRFEATTRNRRCGGSR